MVSSIHDPVLNFVESVPAPPLDEVVMEKIGQAIRRFRSDVRAISGWTVGLHLDSLDTGIVVLGKIVWMFERERDL